MPNSQYYSNANDIGNYQWVSFNEVLEELMLMTIDNDSYMNNIDRTQIIRSLKNGVKLLSREVRKKKLAIEFIVPNALSFPLPHDYVNWTRISVVENGQMFPININEKMNIARAISQNATQMQGYDNIWNIAFLSNGNIITLDQNNVYNEPFKHYTISKEKNPFYTKGDCVFDVERGLVAFSSELIEKTIVLEYYSDGLYSFGLTQQQIISQNLKPIKIHKDLKEVLIKFVYQEIIGYRRNVPANEKQRARQEYKTYLHQAKIDRLDFDLYKVAKIIDR